MNYKGIKPANIVTVLEGNGTKDEPFKNVKYILEYIDTIAGIRLVTTGKLVELTEDEKKFFD